MVRGLGAAVLLAVASALWAAETPAPASDPAASPGPVLYGDTAGRLWAWQGGEKTWLTDGKQNLVLGGVGETELWGWSVTRGEARTFTLPLPKKKDAPADPQTPADPKAKPEVPPAPKFDQGVFPVPDLADRAGVWVVAAYGPQSAAPRIELFQMGLPFASLAWDDGRVIYAVSVTAEGHWLAVGRTRDGAPWLNRDGRDGEAPAGWRGRLTIADAAGSKAAGWGALGDEAPTALFWTQGSWTRPAVEEGALPTGGTFPVLGRASADGWELAGWRADPGTGALRPWFWDGTAQTVGAGAADGLPVAFGTGKTGPFLVVRHESGPAYTREDGGDPVALAGLGAEDRVVAVAAEPKKGAETP